MERVLLPSGWEEEFLELERLRQWQLIPTLLTSSAEFLPCLRSSQGIWYRWILFRPEWMYRKYNYCMGVLRACRDVQLMREAHGGRGSHFPIVSPTDSRCMRIGAGFQGWWTHLVKNLATILHPTFPIFHIHGTGLCFCISGGWILLKPCGSVIPVWPARSLPSNTFFEGPDPFAFPEGPGKEASSRGTMSIRKSNWSDLLSAFAMSARDNVRRLFESATIKARAVISDIKTGRPEPVNRF